MAVSNGNYSWKFSNILHEITSKPGLKGKTSQELRMLSRVTLNCQVTKIVMNSGSQLSGM